MCENTDEKNYSPQLPYDEDAAYTDTLILKLQDFIRESKHIVFFGGAGVSTESGIPDYRSPNGLYRSSRTQNYSPEVLLSRTFFDRHTEDFFDFYIHSMLHPEARPNAAHKKLAELEAAGKDITIITQNIDGLHQMAGSKKVVELHGSAHRNFCMVCHEEYTMEDICSQAAEQPIPLCKKCGGIIKPSVVLYEESLDSEAVNAAVQAISQAELLIVAGTSLSVYPAAGFVRYFQGDHSVYINFEKSERHIYTDIFLQGRVGDILSKVYI